MVAVWAGDGSHDGCSVLFSHTGRASIPSPVQAVPTTTTISRWRERVVAPLFLL
jgi:hypothetical protein